MLVVWSINIGNAVGESYEIASKTENILCQSNKNESVLVVGVYTF
jgi:hypothetical protein